MGNFYSYFAFLLCLGLVFRHFLRGNRKRKLQPSPPALPILGHLHLMGNSPPQALERLASKYGPILFLRFGSHPYLIVSSPSAVEECFTKNDVIFADRPRTVFGDYLTYNYSAYVWASYGHLWRCLRRLTVVQVFSSRSLQKSSTIREEETRNLISHLCRVSGNGSQKVELKYWFSLLTFNIMMRLVAGKQCIRDEDVGTEAGKQFLAELYQKFLPTTPLNLCDFFPVLRWFDFQGLEKGMKMLHKKRDEFLQGLIDEFRRQKDNSSNTGGKNTSLIETLLGLQESEPDFYTDDLIKSIILIMFIGGTETSAATMEQAISLLIDHPLAFQKVRAEIENQVGHKRLPDDLDLAKLPFLHCVINETLRLYPPVPVLLPHCASEDCTVAGFEVPRGTTLLVNVWAIHRDPKYWDEPNKFKPERFEVIEGEREAFKFIPFGMGRRACPGSNMGMRAVALAVGALIQCFEFERVGQKEDVNRSTGLPTLKVEAVCIARQNALELLSQL